ncbi:hypothetical protein PENFLA_c015G01918 [Penicillium flavigenum]|uniref:Mitochondrial division protein 1 n=1 Tax=Penicillium flavigenum TaxID=254877 RepID=A0A1V6T3X5_9EURO|nr:hypothetical protein PENFLA_c015G01918 [Penicillium flavigenum]
MAGTGKSTIARTVAQSLAKRGLLGATFFFKRGEAEGGKAKYSISSIARQLVTAQRRLEPDILKVIKTDPRIASKFLSEQFDKLLYWPLKNLDSGQPTSVVIVIDALDECDRDEDMRVIIRLMSKLQEIKSLYLRVFLTSRPELPVRLGFRDNKSYQNLVLHELPVSVVENDIRLFLKSKLAELRDERSLSPDWPGDEIIEQLVKLAVPLFIFAATACRFIEEGLHPKKRLKKFLEFQARGATQMDKVYLPVLNQLLTDDDDTKEILEEFQDIVGAIILLATPLSLEPLAVLVQKPADEISELLNSLHSVLNIPSDLFTPIRILHLSFRDYLLTARRSFHIDEEETHEKIAAYCLRAMKDGLKSNICNLASYGTQYKDIDPQVINQHLTADLQYSTLYWVHHLKQSKGRISEFEILSFLKKHFLRWLEALALIGCISDVVGIIYTLRLNTWRLPVVRHSWSPNLQTLEGHSSSVNSVAFSPDRRTLASGSEDQTIKLWDTSTGIEQQTLEGHSDSISSVVFSPDARGLASGSEDQTIKFWDTTTGMERQTLEGRSDPISSGLNGPSTKFQISLSNTWVSLGGENLLWLPTEYRAATSHTFNDDTVALGYMNGRVSIIGFQTL